MVTNRKLLAATAMAVLFQAAGTQAQSIEIGTNAAASTNTSIAIGNDSVAVDDGTTAVGDGAEALNPRATAAGAQAQASGANSVAVGAGATAANTQATALGVDANASNILSTAIGGASRANLYGTAVGAGAQATGLNAQTFGTQSVASGTSSVAVGHQTRATGVRSTALGQQATATGTDSLALGSRAAASAAGGVALGSDSVTGAVVNTTGGTIGGTAYTYAGTNAASTVSLGYTGFERTLTNVAAGRVTSLSTDAVNGSQLFATNQAIETVITNVTTLQDDALLWDPALAAFSASRAGIAQNRITNVAAGDVSSASTDAVNGSQLFAVETQVDQNTTDITNINSTVTTLSNDALLWDPTLAAFSASHAGVAQNRITNVAAGDVSSTSTDAVNGSQLHAVQTQVDQNTTNIANLDTRVSTAEGDITAIDNRVTTIEGDVSNLTTTVNEQADQIAELDASAVKYDRNADGSVNYNNVTLAGQGGTTISNVAAGVADTDAVNVAQLRDAVDGLSEMNDLAVQYVADDNGKATNTVALTGDGTGSPVKITNVAAGTSDMDAVNYGQVKNQVAYDTDANGVRTNTITLSGNGGAAVRIGNVADGVAASDAVNVSQLNGVRQDAYNYTDNRVTELREYTDNRINNLSGDIRELRSESRGGIASTMAAAQLRYADRPGVVSVAAGFGGFKGSTSFAGGLGWTSQDLKWRVNGSVGVSLDNGDVAWGVGASYAFD